MTFHEKNHPFNRPLVDSKLSPKFKALEGDQNKIIREIQVRAHATKDAREVVEIVSRGFRVFEKLRDKYHINIPNTEFVIGNKKKTGYATLYTRVDLIEGQNLTETDLPTEAKEKLENFYCSLLQSYADIYLEGGDFWRDFNNTQIVYGHKKESPINDFYIVDLDTNNIAISNYDLNRKNISNKTLFEQIFAIAFAIKQAEEKFNSPLRLEKSRNKIIEIIKTIDFREPEFQILRQTVALLE